MKKNKGRYMTKRISTKALSKLCHKDQVRFALFCADQVRHMYVHGPEAIRCREVLDNWLENKATLDECIDAVENLRLSSNDMDYFTPLPICTLIDAASISYREDDIDHINGYLAADVAEDAARLSKHPTKTIKQQRQYFNELLNLDNILEDIILKGK